MKYRAIVGHGDNHVYCILECSVCGRNLRNFRDEIEKRRLKYCPECGRKLAWLDPSVKNEHILEVLNREADAAREGGAK